MADIFRMIYAKWNPPSDPKDVSFANCTVVVTGANTGLGLEAVIKYVALDAARVILGVRSMAKGLAAKSTVEARTADHRKDVADVVEVWELDMDRFESVKAFADRVKAEIPRLDVVLLNAGVQLPTFQKSPEGWEETLQVNVLSTAMLGLLLLPKLKAANKDVAAAAAAASSSTPTPPHLSFVSSGMYSSVPTKRFEGIKPGGILQDLNDPEKFKFGEQYAISKLLVMYVVAEIAARAVDSKTGQVQVIVNSLCPGAARSDMARHFLTSVLMRMAVATFLVLCARTTEQGSRTLVSATALGTESQGMFWQNDQIKTPSALAAGEEGNVLQTQVWKEIVSVLKENVPEIV